MFQDISKRSDGAKIVLPRYLSRLVHKNENISEVFVLVLLDALMKNHG
jgi:hypothetical protein